MALMCFPLNDIEYLAEDMQAYTSTRTTGVFSSETDFVVTVNSGMSVTVSPGQLWASLERFLGVAVFEKEETYLTLDYADGIFPRIDRIVVRVDRVANKPIMVIKKGIPASNPVPIAIERNPEMYEVAICDITIPKGVLQLTQGNVNNSIKLNESVCGLMRDGVTGIPTQHLYDVWWDWFNALKINAEQKAQTFLDWMDTFKKLNEAEFDKWFANFSSEKSSIVDKWFEGFEERWEKMLELLSDIDTVKILNKIDTHEKTTVLETNGVHGSRVFNNVFQFFNGSEWKPVLEIINNLTSTDADKGLSANQGNILNNNKVEKQIILESGTDLNDIRESGIYRLRNSHINIPSSTNTWIDSQMLVAAGNNTIFQIIGGRNGGVTSFWVRTGTMNVGFNHWKELATTDLPTVSDTCIDVSNGDWNHILINGRFKGSNITNAPLNDTSWYHGYVISSGNDYVIQRIQAFTGSQTGKWFERRKGVDTWTSWKQVDVMSVEDKTKLDKVAYSFEGMNWRTKDSLPSEYPIGITLFHNSNKEPLFPLTYGTVLTIRSYVSSVSFNAIQYLYPYNNSVMPYYRYSIFNSNSWTEWKQLASTSDTIPATRIAAGTFPTTEISAAQGTDYTTKRIRNAYFSTTVPSTLSNGEICFVYE